MDTTQSSLLEAIKAYLAGDSHGAAATFDQWREFYATYNDILTRFATKQRFRGDEIEDLMQDVWMEVIRHLPAFDYDQQRGGFRRWLYTIVRTRTLDRARRRKSRQNLRGQLLDFGYAAGAGASPDSDPSEELDRAFRVEIVRVALERLQKRATDLEWQVFHRCRIRDQSSTEAAGELAISAESVRKALQRAHAKLRAALIELLGSSDDLENGGLM